MQRNKCRLCDGELLDKFTLTLLNKYDVKYSECAACLSLQTEPPYWLDEAYTQGNLSNLDTGSAQRNINNLAVCFAISKLFGITNILDIGGGDGLLCRLLRDYGLNCYVKDKFATPKYAQGFTLQNFETPDLILCFEAIEHFSNTKKDLDQLFDQNPPALLISTSIYSNQQQDWWYLSPQSGQHVFFYSQKAIELIANTYNYEVITRGSFIFFIKHASNFKKFISWLCLSHHVYRWIKSIIFTLPTPNVWTDYLAQQSKLDIH